MSNSEFSSDFISSFAFFSTFKSFQEKEVFQNIKELNFLSYYQDFKLIICSKCSQALISSGIQNHLEKDLKNIKIQERRLIISKAMNILNSLEILEIKDSLDLIKLFSTLKELNPLKDLKVLNLFSCKICSLVLSSTYSIKRHIWENHKGEDQSSFLSIKGQALGVNKFFFQVQVSNLENLIIREEIQEEEENIESNSYESNSIQNIKQAFLSNFSKKEESFNKTLQSYQLDPKEKLSLFQQKTRYSEYINKFKIKDLVDLNNPLKEEEIVLNILISNLKEILYLSLEKSIFLTKLHLNILNSFEANKICNKGFKPLLNSNTRVWYFSFFSQFLIFYFRAFKNNQNNKFFLVSDKIKDLTIEVYKFASENQDSLISIKDSLKLKRSKINNSLIQVKIDNFKRNRWEEINEDSSSFEEEDTEDNLSFSISTLSSKSNLSIRDLESNINLEKSSSSSSSNDSFYQEITGLDNNLEISNKEVLKDIKAINNSDDLISNNIKSLLLNLLLELFKQTLDLNIFTSPINCFFISNSIWVKDYSFKDSLELS